ncbi:MAG TPA: VOC family protein [Nitrospira sp.]|nr:VOC family protein [Nitrospira sp.]
MSQQLHRGLRHLALRVTDLPRSRQFYEQLLGFQAVWEPDPENIYFSSGVDNLALHQISKTELDSYDSSKTQRLDHMGVILDSPATVDLMYQTILSKIDSLGGRIAKQPKQHRDGSYSFYFADPDGNLIQALYEPSISGLRFRTET